MSRSLFSCFIAASFFIFSPNQTNASEQQQAQVLMLGVFHFANPGKDTVKTKQMNVMTETNQSYLNALALKFLAFNPTHILLECDIEKAAEYQKNYQSYLKGTYELSSNENYQLGFRIAKAANLMPTQIICYNESTIGWNADLLFEYMPEHDKPAKQAIDKIIADITEETTKNHQTKSLAELLQVANDPVYDQQNKSLYLVTNGVGAGGNFAGADAAASWWHRNFRMYANVQKIATPGTRVLVIGGQGHTAILKDLLKDDPQRTAIDVRPFLK